ncbi:MULTISPECIES: ABC transporter ATP-binding protein [Sulfurospirillum]|uniref:ABC transporter ATP-binding protein n=4 Tax=Sulfurospirillum TaxID=57665 RepID=A0A1Y0HNI3_9BACT|nr:MULTISPECIES: ABC transporter ATP-binding protein [Sulfurospirillum]AHJ12813.1 corrinoid ABC transporter ATPase BtuD [Sulfurospirillum multivorans DSM 12446]AOO65292.1 corrinoid ABC transporter ATPase BtuD [Sulfurospirillum halorespirans DSM 13726]ARU48773.1 corrinoid ABC transporter ATPase BtuD [Sulfurospirillum diekertiae]ASC93595.1 corrinoid ABC transporter ATPase BtuD [Sulfurospirillum diekertiae]ATB69639.1 corrinoid ABC transporter ATPase BtuD [Sulfurospirillum diekertiae]
MSALHVKNLGYKSGSTSILENINLSLEVGKFYGILGPNGSGKTTLLDCLAGLVPKSHGEIEIFNVPCHTYSRKEFAQQIALVPQNFDISFPYKVQEILEMGRYPFKKRMHGLSAKEYALIDQIKDVFELNFLVDKEVTNLSGGEKQRVAFAKALIQDTPILFLDESTSNMDPYFAHFVLKEVQKRTKNEQKTVLAVFHDMNLASRYCDEIIMLKDGGLLEMGTTKKVLTPINIKRLFGIESIAVHDNDKSYIIPV